MGFVFARNHKNGRKWYISYKSPNGKWKRKVSSSIKKDAKLELSEIESNILKGKYGLTEKSKVAFNDFTDEYLSKISKYKKSYKSDVSRIKNLKQFFKKLYIDEIKVKQVDNYIEKRLNTNKTKYKKITMTTVNREIELLKAMMNKAIEWEYMQKNPIMKVKKFKEEPRDRIISVEEQRKLISLAPTPLKYWIVLALNTGMRRGEIINLKWEDININNNSNDNYIFVKHTKTYRSRKIPMNETLVNLFHKLQKNKNGYFVFVNPLTGKPYTDFKNSWKTLLQKAQIENLTFHDLRGVFATYFLAKHHDVLALKYVLGHKDIQTTMRYAQPMKENIEKAINSLDVNEMNNNRDIRKFFK